jgi:rifampicin phosphotransferase
MRWIRDNDFDPRYPFWTRANISEVLPEPPSPLGWDLVWEGACVSGWRDVLVQRFGMEDDELDVERVQAVGIYGGYAYLGAALFRVWAGRMPGMTPTTIDDVFFGDHPDVPPYVAEAWHANPRTTEKMAQWLRWATVDFDERELEQDRLESLQIRAARPDYSAMSEASLLGHALSFRPLFRRLFHQHINQNAAASVGPGLLGAVCTDIGKPQWTLSLLAALGDVDSAAPSYRMWDLSRMVRASHQLTQLFEAGTEGLHARLMASEDVDVVAFVGHLDQFLGEFGARGANEWDLVAGVWEIRPDTALAAIDRLRLADDSASPVHEHDARLAERLDIERQVRANLADDPERLARFEVGLRSATTFIPGRERSKTTIVRVIHEARLATAELGHRFVTQRKLRDAGDIYMLFVDELIELVAGNLPEVTELVEARAAYRVWLSSIEPPFIISGHAEANTRWPRRTGHGAPLSAGDVIKGVAGSAGVAYGRTRVITDPSEPGAFEPGDIVVAPVTDPSWTPLFVIAAAVIVDVGALLSHAVIVSRELGIPCVVSSLDASKRIPDGSLVAVDGDAGTVTILEVPTCTESPGAA